MLGTSAVMAAELHQGGGFTPVVQVVLTGLGAAMLLYVYRRRAGPRPGVETYLVFLIGFAWLVNFPRPAEDWSCPLSRPGAAGSPRSPGPQAALSAPAAGPPYP